MLPGFLKQHLIASCQKLVNTFSPILINGHWGPADHATVKYEKSEVINLVKQNASQAAQNS